MTDKFKVANCRGSLPVLNDIKRAFMILSSISVELNECEASFRIKTACNNLWRIIEDEGYEINYNNRLIKKK